MAVVKVELIRLWRRWRREERSWRGDDGGGSGPVDERGQFVCGGDGYGGGQTVSAATVDSEALLVRRDRGLRGVVLLIKKAIRLCPSSSFKKAIRLCPSSSFERNELRWMSSLSRWRRFSKRHDLLVPRAALTLKCFLLRRWY